MSEPRPFIARFGEFIRFSHTIFALPFALMSMLVAAHGLPEAWTILWILVCMASARTAAMIFNRLADWEIDKENPRTENRHKLIHKNVAKAGLLGAIAVFVFGCWKLNMLCVVLAPVAVAIICFYSITKRFTSYAHLFLGLALAVSPMGAWIAVTGEMHSLPPYILSLAVLLWVFGFDLIYATMDMEFDRKKGLFSFPATHGWKATLKLALGLHIAAVLVLGWFGWTAGLGGGYAVALLAAVGCLVWEHHLGRKGDAFSVNRAFFQANAAVGLLLLGGILWDIFVRP